ncbi:scavenger receptor class B member 1-like isoform X2 [Thrips palmi]|nr:scavenger receptor class B member 1-like isoform X2 [Thrips palmi]
MTAEKKAASKWPHLRYSRAAADLGPSLHGLHGDELQGPTLGGRARRKRCGLCRITCGVVVAVLFLLVLAGSALLCFTNFFETMVRRGLVFQEDGPLFAGWRQPALKPLVRVFVYNYTNSDEFLEGLAPKLRVQEVGPYSYRETLERVNIRFHDNGTMSYSEKRTHVFEPTLSGGSEDDVVTVPNLPLIGAMARVVNEGAIAQFALNGAFLFSPPAQFDRLRAKDFLFGYNNSVYNFAKGVSALSQSGPVPKLGLIATRSGLSNDRYTVFTGKGNFSLLDVVSRFNGREALSVWESDDCNRIDGSEGAFFNLDALRDRRPVHVFNAGICRRLALEFKSETTVMDGIPALRYGPPDNFFHNALDNSDNACYRHSSFDTHLPSGVFNNSACSYGSPTYLSFPHFYLGDPSLRNVVDGMDPPDPEKHQMYFTIHPVLGMNLGAVSRIQINVMIKKASYVPQLNRFEDGMIIPVAWIETNARQFPEETKRAVYHATFTLRAVEKGMMYAFPILTFIMACILACIIIPCGTKRPKEPPIQVIRLS